MPYKLRITKRERDEFGLAMPIPREDWKKAVSQVEGIRLRPPSALTGRNPKTGEEIKILSGDGNVEVYFPTEGVWRLIFRWANGYARFTVNFKLGDLSHPTWAAAVALASRLGVVIMGENKEVYDLATGQPDLSGIPPGTIDYSPHLREYRIKFELVPSGRTQSP